MWARSIRIALSTGQLVRYRTRTQCYFGIGQDNVEHDGVRRRFRVILGQLDILDAAWFGDRWDEMGVCGCMGWVNDDRY